MRLSGFGALLCQTGKCWRAAGKLFSLFLYHIVAGNIRIGDDGVGDCQRRFVVFKKTFSLYSNETVLYYGVVDIMTAAFSCLHEPDSVPLSCFVLIERLQSVTLKYYRIVNGPVYYKLSFAPSPQPAAVVEIYS